jgi:1-phosphatidylinositol-5-phosphate 4-kinase
LDEIARHEQEAEAEGESGDDLGPSPPDSPVPSVATFNLDEEFFAIASSDGSFFSFKTRNDQSFSDSPKKYIYFVGLVDILTYYGVKKRTASAAKSVKYGAEAENISTVKPDQVSFYQEE